MRSRITKSFTFDAAHWLPRVPPEHKCGRLHGHTYTIILGVEGELDPQLGWVMDFGEMKRAFAPLLECMDHRNLNDIEGLTNPTAENLACWIYNQLKPALPLLTDVTVQETPTSAAHFRPGQSPSG